jgi:pimeloyl-ACP methyl ester carboxylesterase
MTFAAGLDHAIIDSQGYKMLGALYRAAGETPRPMIILLHGVPGAEQNLDIAYALRDAGLNCLYFHYRGCWGSEGAYSFSGLNDDVHAATEWVLRQPSVDGNRLALVGSSMGGYLVFTAGAVDLRFKALVSICPLVDPTKVMLPMEMLGDFAEMLNGITAHELKSQWEALPQALSVARGVACPHLLLVSGEKDELFPPAHHRPIVEAMPWITWERIPDADHNFSLRRKQLVNVVLRWLKARLCE